MSTAGQRGDRRLLTRLKVIFLATLSFTFIVSAVVQLQAFDREAAWDLATSVPLTGSYYDRYVPVDDAARLAKHLDMATARLTDPRARRDFASLMDEAPLHLSQLKRDGRVFATMYCSRAQGLDDPYFAATQQIIWRLLWSPYASKHPVVVFVCPFIEEVYRQTFAGQGAIVHELPLFDLVSETDSVPERLQDQFAKLNMWNMTQYSTIAYLDSDAFPLANIDEVFDLVREQDRASDAASDDYADIEKYTFAGVMVENTSGGSGIGGGFLVFSPDSTQHERLLENAKRVNEYETGSMDQAFLNSRLGFGKSSPFPAQELPSHYNCDASLYSQIEDGTIDPLQIKILHEKLWLKTELQTYPKLAIWAHLWSVDWMSLSRFYDDPLYPKMRRLGRKPRSQAERFQWYMDVHETSIAFSEDWG